MDHSPPGSSVRGILQARRLERLPFPPPGDLPAHISCTTLVGRWILYHWATWKPRYRGIYSRKDRETKQNLNWDVKSKQELTNQVRRHSRREESAWGKSLKWERVWCSPGNERWVWLRYWGSERVVEDKAWGESYLGRGHALWAVVGINKKTPRIFILWRLTCQKQWNNIFTCGFDKMVLAIS